MDEEKNSVTDVPSIDELPSEEVHHHKVDGGVKAWMSIAGGWLVMFCVFGYGGAFGVFQDLYTREAGVSSSAVSWIGSTQTFLMTALSLPAGKLVDMGYSRHILIGGSVVYIISIFLLSIADLSHYYQLFLAQGVGMGISGGFMYLPAIALQTRHWKRRRALAMGIVFTGSSIGGAVLPVMLNQLLHHQQLGFGWTVRASAFLVLGMLFLANVLITPGPTPSRAECEPAALAPAAGLRNMLKDAPFMIVVLGSFLANCGFYFPLFYIQLYSVFHGVSSSVAFYMVSILSFSSTVGRLVASWSSDRIGVFNNYLPACFGTGILLFAMLGTTSTTSIIVFSVLYGFISGAVATLLAPLVAALTNDPSEIGTRMGVAYFVLAFAYLIGSPIAGALLGTGSPQWWRAIVFSAVPTLAGTLCLAVAWVMMAKRQGTWWI
ncbi:MFS general substrate transporter [Amylostereum chailletii]|nr:MFS general substrate transporter [Amylostereum chailletii]